jgi:hypothetical protein
MLVSTCKSTQRYNPGDKSTLIKQNWEGGHDRYFENFPDTGLEWLKKTLETGTTAGHRASPLMPML